MHPKKKIHPAIKSKLHPRNRHRERYDFKQLIMSCPELAPFVKMNAYQDESIDFFNPEAVKMLNRALLRHYYGITYWDIPSNYLCPPIPGRADYLHYVADLLGDNINIKKIPRGHNIQCLDLGVGANCVYPIIGHKEYAWSFIGTDIDPVAIQSANKIVQENPFLQKKLRIRLQPNAKDIFIGIIQTDECIDVSICNPPFHASIEEAQAAAQRKLRNLKHAQDSPPKLNFGGQSNELWYEGGEAGFVRNMINQSKQFSTSCFWFTSLISKESNLKQIYKALKKVKAFEVKTIPMGQGNKKSRIVAWTFLNRIQQQKWVQARWES